MDRRGSRTADDDRDRQQRRLRGAQRVHGALQHQAVDRDKAAGAGLRRSCEGDGLRRSTCRTRSRPYVSAAGRVALAETIPARRRSGEREVEADLKVGLYTLLYTLRGYPML